MRTIAVINLLISKFLILFCHCINSLHLFTLFVKSHPLRIVIGIILYDLRSIHLSSQKIELLILLFRRILYCFSPRIIIILKILHLCIHMAILINIKMLVFKAFTKDLELGLVQDLEVDLLLILDILRNLMIIYYWKSIELIFLCISLSFLNYQHLH